MMQVLSRSDIFKKSVFVDNEIAFEQQATYRSINHDDADEIAYMIPFLDHLQAFNPQRQPLDGFCVLAYEAETKQDYEDNFPGVMVDFLTRLNINQLILITVIKIDWMDFVFENKEKHKLFMGIVNDQTNAVGLQLEVKDLPEVLPLFFYSHPDHPHINLMPLAGNVSINLLLCKDGNFHTLFDASIIEELKDAADSAGLMTGGYEVCHNIKNNP